MSEIQKGPHWKDGMTFRPNRFLDEFGALKPDEQLIPFSIGKRKCPGETFAMMELFLFFTSLVQHFSFYSESEEELPTEEYIPGLTVLPKPFRAFLKQR